MLGELVERLRCAELTQNSCVFGEMFKKKPILAGKSDLNQAQIIFELVGSPTEHNMPGWQELPGCEGVKAWVDESGNLEREFGRLVTFSRP